MEWFLQILAIPHEIVEVNLRAKAQKTPAFLQMNPLGQVPVLQVGELALPDSNAILLYLAAHYAPDWMPTSPLQHAALQRWFTVAAGAVAFGPAAARATCLFKAPHDLSAVQARAYALLEMMNTHLSTHAFLLGADLSLADIANYAYIARAPEGGVVLESYPHVVAWLQRVEATPRFLPMPAFPVAPATPSL